MMVKLTREETQNIEKGNELYLFHIDKFMKVECVWSHKETLYDDSKKHINWKGAFVDMNKEHGQFYQCSDFDGDTLEGLYPLNSTIKERLQFILDNFENGGNIKYGETSMTVGALMAKIEKLETLGVYYNSVLVEHLAKNDNDGALLDNFTTDGLQDYVKGNLPLSKNLHERLLDIDQLEITQSYTEKKKVHPKNLTVGEFRNLEYGDKIYYESEINDKMMELVFTGYENYGSKVFYNCDIESEYILNVHNVTENEIYDYPLSDFELFAINAIRVKRKRERERIINEKLFDFEYILVNIEDTDIESNKVLLFSNNKKYNISMGNTESIFFVEHETNELVTDLKLYGKLMIATKNLHKRYELGENGEI